MVLGAKAHAAANDNRTAEKLLRKALELDGSSLDAYTTLAGLYLIDHRLAEARNEFIEIARRQPQSVSPAIMVGIISEAMGDRETAVTWYSNALRIDPRAAPAANNLAWIYAERGENLDSAQQLAEIAYSALPSLPEVMDTLGWVYFKKDMLSLALPMLRRANEQAPRNPQYLFHLGMLYAKNGDEAKARSTLQSALSLSRDFEGASDARAALSSLLY
jgi:Tfp pilus assembly protein PilF